MNAQPPIEEAMETDPASPAKEVEESVPAPPVASPGNPPPAGMLRFFRRKKGGKDEVYTLKAAEMPPRKVPRSFSDDVVRRLFDKTDADRCEHSAPFSSLLTHF